MKDLRVIVTEACFVSKMVREPDVMSWPVRMKHNDCQRKLTPRNKQAAENEDGRIAKQRAKTGTG